MVTHVCAQIHELWQQFNNMTPQDLLQQHEYLRMHVLQHPEKVIRQGTSAHAQWLTLIQYPKTKLNLLHRSSMLQFDRTTYSSRPQVDLELNAALNTCFAGRELYRKFQVDADTGFSQSHVAAENANYTLDQIVAMNSIKRTVEHLEHKLDKITDMWQDKERGVGEKLQLSDLETAMKTVILVSL